MMLFRRAAGMLVLALLVSVTAPSMTRATERRSTKAHASTRVYRSTYKAMWLSIAHPGLGEWYLKGWGSFERCPQKKFWLGLIPIYGWPGYLQVKSAIDARHGRTNDDLTFRD